MPSIYRFFSGTGSSEAARLRPTSRRSASSAPTAEEAPDYALTRDSSQLRLDVTVNEMRRAKLMPINLLRELLHDVHRHADRSFSGIGILVSGNLGGLPIVPLRPLAAIPPLQSTRETLVAVSDLAHELHDGFHILSPDFRLIRLSQYFSPPIVFGLRTDPKRRLGGRYMAGLFGSALPDVLVSGIVSATYGVAVFEDGREVPAGHD